MKIKILLSLMMQMNSFHMPDGMLLSAGTNAGGILGKAYTVTDDGNNAILIDGKHIEKREWKFMLHLVVVDIGYLFDILYVRIGPVLSTVFYQQGLWGLDNPHWLNSGGYSSIGGILFFDILNITFCVKAGIAVKWYDVKQLDSKKKDMFKHLKIYKDCGLYVALYRTESFMIFVGIVWYQGCLGMSIDCKRIG